MIESALQTVRSWASLGCLAALALSACTADAAQSPDLILFTCDRDRSFAIRYLDGGVGLFVAGQHFTLDHRPSSMGRRYVTGDVAFIHDEDRGVLVGAPDGPYRNCVEKAP